MAYPLYGSSFSIYRTSPLYTGNESLLQNVDSYAQRMRDHLAGDRARSALLTDLQPDLAGTGSLEACKWTLLGDEQTWERQQDASGEQRTSPEDACGVHIQLRFERAKYAAFLMGEKPRMQTASGFTSLPLLLIRMPATLRELVLDFLATTFDSRISPMKLRPSFLGSSLESLLQHTVPDGDDDPTLSLETLTKGVGIQLSFPSAAPHLKNLDIIISKDDIHQFLANGKSLWREHQDKLPKAHAWAQPPQPTIAGPFTAALSVYLSNHIAMDLENPAVVLSKVAVGPFAIGGEGKVKILTSSLAAVEFWASLIQEAHGKGLEVPKHSSDEIDGAVTKTVEVRGDSRRRRMTSVLTDPPPPYELHDPARRG